MVERLKNLNITFVENFFEKEIIEMEKTYNFCLPNDYKYFLEGYKNQSTDDDFYFKFISSKDTNIERKMSFYTFYGLKNDKNNIIPEIERYRDRMPSSLIPIGETLSDDLICININKESEDYNSIYIWYHEQEASAYNLISDSEDLLDVESYWDNTIKVSNSFNDFLSLIQKDTQETEQGINSTIVSYNLSPELLKTLPCNKK